MPVVTFAFVAYFFVILSIGTIAWWNTRNLADYILGGRRLGPLSAALSAGASDMSGWLLLGLPGYAYVAGLEAVWLAVALLLGSYLNWLYVAPRLRKRSVALGDALTLPEYFSRRVVGKGHSLKVVCGVMILVFYLIYTASGFVAGAKLFESVYGFDYHHALLIGAAAIVAYTFFGGFLAVVWTDVLQGLLMLGALLWVPLVVAADGGSPAIDWETLVPRNDASSVAWITLLSSLAWGLGYFGQPHILARFMAVRDPQRIGVARRIATSWTALCLVGALWVGVAGAGLAGAPLDDPETVFMHMVNTLFHPLVAGVLLAAILAAIMSTADSQLLVASSVLSEDFCKSLFGPELGAGALLWIGRFSVLAMALCAIWIAWNPAARVLDLVGYAWAGFGASIGPALWYSLYVDKVRSSLLLVSMLAGGLTVILWRQGEAGVFELYEMVPGILASTMVLGLGHKISKGRNA